MTELNVAGLSMDPVSKSPILVLRTTSGLFILPIWIGPSEAVSISLALQEVDVPRPLTHDLLLSSVEALGYLLKAARIVRCEEGVFFAELELVKGSKTVLVDCRPSDAVAVALRAQAPILATPEVMNDAGLEYPKSQHQPVLVSAGDGAVAMIAPDHDFSNGNESPGNLGDGLADELESEVKEALANMDPESKYKM